MNNFSTALGLFVDEGEKVCVQTAGFSMEPTLLHGGTAIIIRPYGLRVGKCYAFKLQGTILIHRLIYLSKDKTAILLGDNSRYVERVACSEILGEVQTGEFLISTGLKTVANWMYVGMRRFGLSQNASFKIRKNLFQILHLLFPVMPVARNFIYHQRGMDQ
jgi:hypothetical protein